MGFGNLMPIGRFARSCRLSVKALRHYDELGLLAPAYVDPQSRYRYYSEAQARDAVMIGMLRSLDLPLDTIRNLLAAEPKAVKSVVELEAKRIEAEIASKQAALLSLRHLSEAGNLSPYEIEVKSRSKQWIVRCSGVTDAGSLIDDTSALVYSLFEAVAQSGLATLEPVFVLNGFHEGRERIDLEAGIQINGGESVQKSSVPDGLEIVELPGMTFASLVHVGPYETLGLAHHALIAWLQERGHMAGKTVWEFYLNDPRTVPPEQLETEVAIPLSEADSGS